MPSASRDFYLAYLNSPDWARTRNRALKRANYRCSRCPAKRDLQVHHKTYERLGAELDSDLEVLCFSCHNDHHQAAAKDTELGVYLKLASQALKDDPFRTIADLSESVKRLCVKHRIPGNNDLIAKALNLVCATRLPKVEGGKVTPYVSVVEAEGPLSHGQAVEWLRRLGVHVLTKTMPEPVMISRRELDRRRAMEMVATEMQASLDRCAALERAVSSDTQETR